MKNSNGYILALDQGTTSCRAIIFNSNAEIIGIAQKEITQIYPQPGWVEHDPEEIFSVQIEVAKRVLKEAHILPKDIVSIGITNQRETSVVWDKTSGVPIYNAIVWQDTRTSSICENLKKKGLEQIIKEKTGLVTDSYFSGTKLNWILQNVSGAKEKSRKGDLLFGTIDTWLLWKLTSGKSFYTDFSNASRTMLYNINELCWDTQLLEELEIPSQMLPEVKPSSSDFGNTDPALFDGVSVPVNGIAGDQQSSLFGQACFEPGSVKNTYGTGCFLLMNTGEKPVFSKNGLLTTIAWGLNGNVEYALEGSVFIAGAAVQWLRDGLKIIKNASESESISSEIKDTGGVYFVPAFSGLGTPYWDMYARGAILGITRSTTQKEIARAALESIAYQVRDVLDVMQQDSGIKISSLKVDGGACVNNFLMQFQSDLLNIAVKRPRITESTALGAAFLAGLKAGFWTRDELKQINQTDHNFYPDMNNEHRERLYNGWKTAVRRVLSNFEL